eukprot:365958-Chlamydomonas_euryale.AAC.9
MACMPVCLPACLPESYQSPATTALSPPPFAILHCNHLGSPRAAALAGRYQGRSACRRRAWHRRSQRGPAAVPRHPRRAGARDERAGPWRRQRPQHAAVGDGGDQHGQWLQGEPRERPEGGGSVDGGRDPGMEGGRVMHTTSGGAECVKSSGAPTTTRCCCYGMIVSSDHHVGICREGMRGAATWPDWLLARQTAPAEWGCEAVGQPSWSPSARRVMLKREQRGPTAKTSIAS